MAARARRPFSHQDSSGRPKVGFVHQQRAIAAARVVAARFGWPQDVYRCRRCDCWHHGRSDVDAELTAGVVRVMPDGGEDRLA